MGDIEELTKDALARLHQGLADDGSFTFIGDGVPPPTEVVSTGKIVILKTRHVYDGYLVEGLDRHARPQTLQSLGIFVLWSLFGEPGQGIDIALTHESSQLRILRVKTPSLRPALQLRVTGYCYRPGRPPKHPWLDEQIDPWFLPQVVLTNEQEMVFYEAWGNAEARDTMAGFGTNEGIALLGHLLLDMSRPDAIRDEYVLEGELGYRGVAPGSAELTFWLPGSVAWRESFGL